jgi:hypothetical protein
MKLRNICPICAVVVITWTGLLVWRFTGHNIDTILLATLMGMSAGAVATKYGQNKIWKTLMVVLAVPAVLFVTRDQLGTGLIFLGLIILPSLYFNSRLNLKKGEPPSDRFKDCC